MMNNIQTKPAPKKRAETYDEKVKFEGTLEQMIDIAIVTKPVKKPTKKRANFIASLNTTQ